jgi:hypothetical protein
MDDRTGSDFTEETQRTRRIACILFPVLSVFSVVSRPVPRPRALERQHPFAFFFKAATAARDGIQC